MRIAETHSRKVTRDDHIYAQTLHHRHHFSRNLQVDEYIKDNISTLATANVSKYPAPALFLFKSFVIEAFLIRKILPHHPSDHLEEESPTR